MNIGAKIRHLRKLHSMDQKTLAEHLNVSNKTISSWESNRTEPNMKMIEMMCDVFGCQKTDFLEDVPDYFVQVSDKEYQLLIEYRNSDEVNKQAIERLLAYSEKD